MNNREFDPDLDRTLRVGGRRFVAPEGRQQYLRPTYGSDADGDPSSPKVSRSVALKLLVMVIVILGLLAAVIVIFT